MSMLVHQSTPAAGVAVEDVRIGRLEQAEDARVAHRRARRGERRGEGDDPRSRAGEVEHRVVVEAQRKGEGEALRHVRRQRRVFGQDRAALDDMAARQRRRESRARSAATPRLAAVRPSSPAVKPSTTTRTAGSIIARGAVELRSSAWTSPWLTVERSMTRKQSRVPTWTASGVEAIALATTSSVHDPGEQVRTAPP